MKACRLLALAVTPLLICSGRTVAAEPSKDEAERKELAKFEGTWKYLSIEIEGKKLPQEQLKQWGRIILHGNKFTVKTGDITYRGTFQVDVSARPKRIDIRFTEGPEKGNKLLGVYELEGDTYKVCLGMPGKPRPKGLVTKPGSGHVLEVLKREKANPKK